MVKDEINPKQPGEKKDKDKDGKKKKEFNGWAYYLAWAAFGSAVVAAFIKLVDKWEPPKKDEYLK